MGDAPPRRRLSGDRAFRRAASSEVRLHDAAWAAFAEDYRIRNPLCVDCLARKITEAVHDVHHIKKLVDYPELKFDESNLMSLCKSCHSVRTARGE